MSKYTSRVIDICSGITGKSELGEFADIDELIASARPLIFNFDYPLFDDEYKTTLETKILEHYLMREIGAETYGLWKQFLKTKLREIMPYYNKLYETASLEFDPLFDVHLRTEKTGEMGGTNQVQNNVTRTDNLQQEFDNVKVEKTASTEYGSSQEKSGQDSTKVLGSKSDLYSDTPQGGLNGFEGLANYTYLTNAREISESSDTTMKYGSKVQNDGGDSYEDSSTKSGKIKNTGTRSDTGSNTTTRDLNDHYIKTVEGRTGKRSAVELIREYREAILNIDMMVINELNNLFMLLW